MTAAALSTTMLGGTDLEVRKLGFGARGLRGRVH
jgi:hypothetical protein